MYRACIAVVDPARRLRPVDLISDSRPGSNRTGTLQYGVDDHRDAHIERLDTEFSHAIVDQLVDMIGSSHAKRLILCASPGMLGEIRNVGASLRNYELEIDEVPRDLVKLTAPQLRDRLTDYGLLPACPSRAGA